MISRIQKIFQLKKLSASAFADKVGVPRSTISHILSGRNNPSLEFVQKVLDTFPEIRTEWLVRGEGHMLKATTSLFPDEDFETPTDTEVSQEKWTEEKISDAIHREPGEKTDPQEKISTLDQGRPEISKPGEDKKTSETLSFFDKRNEDVAKKSENADKTNGKAVKIIVFYADGSFSEHLPSAGY